MAVDSNTKVEEIRQVQDSSGEKVVPASDAYGVAEESEGVDVSAGAVAVEPAVPDRATALTGFVTFEDAGHVEVVFRASDGGEIGRRTPSQNPDYAVGSGGQIFVETVIASEQVTVELHDDSDADQNVATWGVRTR